MIVMIRFFVHRLFSVCIRKWICLQLWWSHFFRSSVIFNDAECRVCKST